MLQTVFQDQDDRTAYPTSGVRISINRHQQAEGGHRVRFSFSPAVATVLRRGLHYPRVHLDGTMVNGFRIWAADAGGFTPIIAHSGAWAFTVPCRRVRSREDQVGSADIEFQWDRDETGPVLLIPRLPDFMLPPAVLDKLPNSQVDPATIMERAEKRLQREIVSLKDEAVIAPEAPEVVPQPPAPETIPGEPLQAAPAPSAHAQDLKAALAMVNELVDQLGAEVVLSIDENGHVQAKRRVVQYIDL